MGRGQLALAIICVAGLVGGAAAQETVNITRQQLKPGEVIHQHMDSSTVGTMTGMGPGTQNTSQKMDQWIRSNVLTSMPMAPGPSVPQSNA